MPRAAVAALDVLSDALGSDGSMTMTHDNAMRLVPGAVLVLLRLGTARPMVTAAAHRSTTVVAPERRRAQVTGYVMDDSNIKDAVRYWFSSRSYAEET